MAKFEATTEQVAEVETKVRTVAQALQQEMHQLVQGVAEDSELIFSAHALVDTGRMSRGISSRIAGNTALLRVDAKDPKSGYDYVGVTRFGHRKDRIYPTHKPKADRFFPKIAKAFPIGNNFYSSIKGFAALKTPFGFFRSVSGFHPKKDWAAEALPEVQRNAERAMGKLGHSIEARLT